LSGGAGKDALRGGAGNDVLSGGAGVDTFVFGKKEGNDVIRDFKDGTDLIDLRGQTFTVSENKSGFAVLDLSGGGTVTLKGIDMEHVNADWFL
jgi:Ca2+-binding RTX toxin-like protein